MSFAKIANASPFASFADKKQLAADNTRFCVSEVKEAQLRDGKTLWHLTIHYYDKDLQPVKETLSFDRKVGSVRDDKIQAMRGDLTQVARIHGVYLAAVSVGRQSPFYDLRHDTTWNCLCEGALPDGETADDDDIPLPPEPPAEEDYVPF